MSAHLTAALARRAVELASFTMRYPVIAAILSQETKQYVSRNWVQRQVTAAGMTVKIALANLKRHVSELYRSGHSLRQIAEEIEPLLGRSISERRVHTLAGIRRDNRFSHLLPRVLELYADPSSSIRSVCDAVAKETGVRLSVGWFHARLREAGVLRPRSSGSAKGGRTRAAAFRRADRQKHMAILLAYTAGKTWDQIVETTGCSREKVRDVLRANGLLRRTWKLRKTNSNDTHNAPEGEKDTKPCASRRHAETRESTRHQETRSAAS